MYVLLEGKLGNLLHLFFCCLCKIKGAKINSIVVNVKTSNVGAKGCSLLEWCFIISLDTCWDWFQRTYHCTEEFINALANYVVSYGVRITYRPDIVLLTFYKR